MRTTWGTSWGNTLILVAEVLKLGGTTSTYPNLVAGEVGHLWDPTTYIMEMVEFNMQYCQSPRLLKFAGSE